MDSFCSIESCMSWGFVGDNIRSTRRPHCNLIFQACCFVALGDAFQDGKSLQLDLDIAGFLPSKENLDSISGLCISFRFAIGNSERQSPWLQFSTQKLHGTGRLLWIQPWPVSTFLSTGDLLTTWCFDGDFFWFLMVANHGLKMIKNGDVFWDIQDQKTWVYNAIL